MRLKSILARNMPEGMRRVREQLGEGAIIVQTHEAEGGVLITAAIDDNLIPMHPTSPCEAHEADAPNTREERGPSPEPARTDDVWTEPPADLSEILSEVLDQHNTGPRLAGAIVAAAEGLGLDDPITALAGALQARFRFEPIPIGPSPKPFLIVGPAGSGKTVTLAKLAAQAVLEDKPVTVISTDLDRAGAIEQLGAFAAALNLDLHRAADAAGAAALARAGDDSLVLIDGSASNPLDTQDLSSMGDFAAIAGAEPVLVMPAGLDAMEAGEIAAAYRRYGVRRFIATRLDTTRRLGSLLAAADRGRLAFAQTASSRQIVDALRPTDPSGLASLLINRKENMLPSPHPGQEGRTKE